MFLPTLSMGATNMISTLSRLTTTLYPFDGHGAEDAVARIYRGSRTAFVEKWNGEAWMMLRASPNMEGLQRCYLNECGQFEWDVTLFDKPRRSIFEWHLDHSPGLAFEHQPWLADRNVRPADVCGSYAVYFHKSNNKYKTGKFCHVYRPLLTDARGRKVWGRLEIDGKSLRVRCPEQWLARATYPVIVDPTIGYTSLGASTDTTEDYALAVVYQAASAGQANPGTAYYGGFSSSGTITNYIAAYVYNASGPFSQTRLAASSGISITTGTGAFRSAAITWTGIAASTNYFIVMWSDNATTRNYYDSGGGTGWFNQCSAAAPPDPFPSALNSGTWNNRGSAYVDFTGSAKLPPPSVIARQAVKRAAYY